jgi:hypothetical protein
MRKWINLVEAAWDTDNWWEPKTPDHPLYNAHDDHGDQHPKGYYARFGVPSEAVNRYSYGDCPFLAYAMNERYGWQIRAQINTDDPTDEWIGHAYCVMPDGREIDILGPQEKVDHFESTVRDLTPQQLWDMAIATSCHGNQAEIQEHLNDARKAVDLFIAPKVEGSKD